ncbi:MAG TPA: hypothetical protein VII52_04395 [Gemmatimonadaceae bacterium]
MTTRPRSARLLGQPHVTPSRRRLAAVAIALIAAAGCAANDIPPSSESTSVRDAAVPASRVQARAQATVRHARDTSVDMVSPTRPGARLTPGATFPVTAADVCTPGYSRSVRNVPAEVKQQAYAEYGIASHPAGAFEVDHLISLELGGSNSIKNLWPESYHTEPWNARVKDALENRLHQEVCAGKTSLAQAQHEIATDWIAAYKSHFHRDAPLPHRARAAPPSRRR